MAIDSFLLVFTVPGTPVAKGRARSVLRGGTVGHYTPERTARYERHVRDECQLAMDGRRPYDGAVDLTLRIYMPIPVSWPKDKREDAAAGVVLPATRPDLDNVIKAVTDGMTGVAWLDDAQIVRILARKLYDLDPRVEIHVREAA